MEARADAVDDESPSRRARHPGEVLLQQRGAVCRRCGGLDWQRFPCARWLRGAGCPVGLGSQGAGRDAHAQAPAAAARGRARAGFLRTSVAGDAPAEVDYALLAWMAGSWRWRRRNLRRRIGRDIDDSYGDLVQLSSYEEGPLLGGRFCTGAASGSSWSSLRHTVLTEAAIMTGTAFQLSA